jgi:hypothetical protein
MGTKGQHKDENERPGLDNRASGISQLSKLTSEFAPSEEEEDRCRHCGSEEFKVTFIGGEKQLVCGGCGRADDEDTSEREREHGVEKKGEGETNKYRRFYT